jgi:uncharacterized membrane protein
VLAVTGKKRHEVIDILIPIVYGMAAVIVSLLVCGSGQYPYGSETMGHLYLGEVFYRAILAGNPFPLYDAMCYNGVGVLQSVAPGAYYVLALCQMAVGGDSLDGYLVFVGLVSFLGAMSWFVLGRRQNRPGLGAFLGLLWFFMPNNLFVLFFEGNLPRALCMIALPFFVGGVCDYLAEGRRRYWLEVLMVYAVVVLCDLEYAVMLVVGAACFCVLYGIFCGRWRRVVYLLTAMVLGAMVTGLLTLPHLLTAGVVDNTESMYRYFQSIFKTLNPLERSISLNQYYYFGLAVFFLTLLGILCGRRKSLPAFGTGLLLLFGTTTSMYSVLRVIPGGGYFPMCQYISLALCFVLYGFVEWDSLRKPVIVVLCALLALDSVPSLNLIYGTMSGISVAERFEEQDETTLISKAKEITKQRAALLDGSELETMGAYLLSGYENGKAATFGMDWTTAATSSNLVQLNKALNNGFYPYLFDRCKELGNDTVLVKLSQINTYEAPVEQLDEAAEEAGYELADSNEFYRLYHMEVEGNWGTVTHYPAIGIGSAASSISLGFPAVEEVSSTNLNDYTFEELSQYQLIYLAGFTYDDKEKAEQLVLDLSEAGVRIVILADGIPEDKLQRTKNFLGVICNDIQFSQGYPLLDTKVGVLDCDFFPQGYEEWSTVYVNGLDETWGTVREENLDLDFYGTVKNDNIIVLGLNLSAYYSMTKDEGVGELLTDITRLDVDSLPDRTVVPLEVAWNDHSLTITSEQENVNTSLAYHEMFRSAQNIAQENNLLYVGAGTTVIQMTYRYLYPGLGMSLLGVVLSVLFYIKVRSGQERTAAELGRTTDETSEMDGAETDGEIPNIEETIN